MIGDLLSGLAHANLALACAVVAVVAARKPVRRLFGARAAYALWLAAPLATAAVLLPRPATPTLLSPVTMTVSAVVAQAAPRGFDWSALTAPGLFGLWLAGAAAAAALMAWRQAQFLAEVRAGRAGPAVVGALRPRIVTPSDFEARFAPAEREVILSHEAVHLEGGDAAINAMSAALQCLCWFNPLAHLAAHLARIDQELACDAAVVGRHPQARKLYAAALLKTQLTTQPLPLGCHWPSAATHPLKERIVMLKSPLPRRARRIAGMAVVCAASASAAVAAWAAQPGALSGLDPGQVHAGPGQGVLCKPDANHELHNCQVVETPWAKLATAADVAREYPRAALARGLTADVFLQCGVDGTRLAGCRAKKVYADQPQSAAMDAAFEAAAVKVAALYRLKSGAKIPDPSFMTIQFRAKPAMPGGPAVGPPPTHAPDALPVPASAAKLRAEALRTGDVDPTAAPTVTEPVWAEKPTPADFARLYPAAAVPERFSGFVVLTCRIGADGRLANCGVARSDVQQAHGPSSPEPMDVAMAFGTATLQLAKLFRMETKSRDGAAVAGGVVRIPVRWVMASPA